MHNSVTFNGLEGSLAANLLWKFLVNLILKMSTFLLKKSTMVSKTITKNFH